MIITCLKVEGFRSYGEETVFSDLRPVNVLVGRNDTGKSNAVELLRFVYAAAAQANPTNGYRPIADFITRNRQDLSIEIHVEPSAEDRQDILGRTAGDQKTLESLISSQFLRRITHHIKFNSTNGFIKDTVAVSNVIDGDFKIFEGLRETGAYQLRSCPNLVPPETSISVIRNFPEFLTQVVGSNPPIMQLLWDGGQARVVDFLRDFYSKIKWIPPLRQSPSALQVNEAREIAGSGNNLPQVWNTILSNNLDEFVSIRDDIKGVIDIESIQAPVRGQQTIASIKERSGTNFDVGNTSTGNQEAIILATAFRTFPKGSIVLLEEPEIHLHARAQRALLKLMKNSSTRLQFFITTHSTVFAHPDPNASIYLVTKTGDDSHVRLVQEPEELGQVRLELGSNNADLYGYDIVVFTEGDSEEVAIPLLMKSMKIDTRERGIRIQNIKGSGKVKKLGQYLEYLKDSGAIPFIIADGNKEVGRKLTEWEASSLIPKGNYRVWPMEFEDLFSEEFLVSQLSRLGYGDISVDAIMQAKGHQSVVHAINKVIYEGGFPSLDKPALAEAIAESIMADKSLVPPALNEALQAISNLVVG